MSAVKPARNISVLNISKHSKRLSDFRDASKAPARFLDEERSLFSRILFLWLGPLLQKGVEHSLVFDDINTLKQKYRSINLIKRWKIARGSRVLTSLLHYHRSSQFLAVLAKLGSVALDYVNPILLKLLIDMATSPGPLSRGLTIAVLIFVIAELKSNLIALHMYLTSRDGAISMSLLANSIAKKSLLLSPLARAVWPTGRIVNLLSSDTEGIVSANLFIHMTYSIPLELCIATVYLFHTLGLATLGTVVVLVILVPVNYVGTRLIRLAQVLSGMRVVKLYAWEAPVQAEIERLRQCEVNQLMRISMLSRILQAINSATPYLVAVVCFTWFVMVNPLGSLTPQIAFVSLMIFNMLRRPLTQVSPAIQLLSKALVGARRIDEFLKAAEVPIDKDRETPNADEPVEIKLENAYFSWDGQKDQIRDISLSLREGSFHAIVGPVGAGKSSVLAAISGDMILSSGNRRVKGTVAYVGQTPWILNKSVKANILYGLEYDKLRYDKVVKACDLRKDFFSFSRYDATLVGDNGADLSGGQKARISLARALYMDSEIYLLDDIFSALDPQVTKILHDQLFGQKGLLTKKTVVLATHNVETTQYADIIHIMQNGEIKDFGLYDDLCERSSLFSKIKADMEKRRAEIKIDELKPRKKPKAVMFEPDVSTEQKKMEHVEVGTTKFAVYHKYIKAFSYHWCFIFLALYAGRYSVQALSGLWLSNWSDQNSADRIQPKEYDSWYYLHFYIALGVGTVFLNVLAFISSVFGSVRASVVLHKPLIAALIHAPLRFYNQTPIGNLLSRLSGDLDIVDNPLPINIRLVVDCFMNITMILFLIALSMPIYLVFVVPFIVAYFMMLKYFIPTTRQISRLEGAQRSLLLSTLTQNIHGVSSIRAYGRVRSTLLAFHEDVDSFLRCRYMQPAAAAWLNIRLALLGNIMVLICALMVSFSHQFDLVTAGDVGLCVSYALTLTEAMSFSVRQIVLAENNIIAVERVKQYHRLEKESSWSCDSSLPDSWPPCGSIEIQDFSFSYDGKTSILKNWNLSIEGGEKIALVGRTGSGKSTVVSSLLRLVETSSGDISIDGVNIRELGLQQLRSRIIVIPQDPFLFSSTLRFNLDPFDQMSDSDIWSALEACQLKDKVSENEDGLLCQIDEGGANISVGERQLVCLCRALLKGGQIVILDEATANVDANTEELVYRVVSEYFKNSTVIIISHRLDAILECDRVVVVEDGEISEIGEPKDLLCSSNSQFSLMMSHRSTIGVPK